MLALVTALDEGFFYGTDDTSGQRDVSAPTAPPRRFTMVAVDGLRAPLQFNRVRVELDRASTEHLVVGTHSPRVERESLPQLLSALGALFPSATITFLLESAVGKASVRAAAPANGTGTSTPSSVAAAVATWMFAGSWDETDPIVVRVDERPMAVRVERLAHGWLASVTPVDNNEQAQ